MKLGKESRYAIEGLMVLANHPDGAPIELRHIAAAAGAPPEFLAKIFQKLKRADLVISSRGAVRGYALAHPPAAINVAEILAAVEGDDVFDRCVFWSDPCADRTACPLHFEWKVMRRSILESMEKITLTDVAQREKRRAGSRQRRR